MGLWDVFQALVPLFVVTGLLYLTLRYIKKKGFVVGGKKSKQVQIQTLSSHMLMPRKYLSVVKVNDKVFVLGVADSITLIKELDAINFKEEIEIDKPLNENMLDVLKKNFGMK